MRMFSNRCREIQSELAEDLEALTALDVILPRRRWRRDEGVRPISRTSAG